MGMRWCVMFSGLVFGCGDGGTSTPIAEVEVVDTEDVSRDTEDGEAGTTSPDTVPVDTIPADTSVDTVDNDTMSPEVEPDTSAADAAMVPCDEGCPPGTVCDEDVCVCDTTPVSFATDVAPRFTTGCGPGCHVYTNAASGSAGLNLAQVHAYGDLVGVAAFQCRDGRQRVVPGDPGASYLMDKMLGVDMCSGVRMPKGRQLWSAADLAMLGRWICQGALDN
jgi:hypothetical protein